MKINLPVIVTVDITRGMLFEAPGVRGASDVLIPQGSTATIFEIAADGSESSLILHVAFANPIKDYFGLEWWIDPDWVEVVPDPELVAAKQRIKELEDEIAGMRAAFGL